MWTNRRAGFADGRSNTRPQRAFVGAGQYRAEPAAKPIDISGAFALNFSRSRRQPLAGRPRSKCVLSRTQTVLGAAADDHRPVEELFGNH